MRSTAGEGAAGTTFVGLSGGRVEVLDLPGNPQAPGLVLLHEGLGSVDLWRGLPVKLNQATQLRTIAFSRFGHGRSDAPPRPRTASFMHEEAREVLPALLASLNIERPILVGHSDGGSIALIFAAEHEAAGLVLIAPHVFVEDLTITAIAAVRETFQERLLERMKQYHNDPVVTFHGWCNVWLDPTFRSWTVEPLLAQVSTPTLLIQGSDDQYGTLAQIERIRDGICADPEILVVPGGHSPHLEQEPVVLPAMTAFIHRVLTGSSNGRERRHAPPPPG